MKVKELIEKLSCMDQDARVVYAYNYGDYWKTTVTEDVGAVSDGFIREDNGCNNTGKDELLNYDDEDTEGATAVVVLE